MAIEYTVKKLAEIFGVSPQAIYKQKDNNPDLRAVMTRDFKRKKNNSVVYGKETYNLLCEIYKDRLKGDVETVVETETTSTTTAPEVNQDNTKEVEQPVETVSQGETTFETAESKLIHLLEEQVEYLKTQLAEEKQARKADAENYLKIVEEANAANGELRILLLNSKEQIKLLEEAKTPFFKRLKNKLVKSNE